MAANTTTAAATSTVNPIAAAATSAGGSLLGTIASGIFNTYQAKKQQEWNEQMQDKQNAWSLDMWNKTNEYNSPKEQIKRLQDAGLNPLYYGLDGSSANGLESAQALGYERADMKNVENPLGVGVQTMMQAKALDKELELKNAQIDKIKEDTRGVGLDNDFKEKTMDARVESAKLKNDATKAEIDNARQELKNKQQQFKKLIAETDNEIEKKALIQAETAVQNALKSKADEETKTIIALRPYEIMLKEAQTEAQKAAAAASYASAAINQGLLDAGYVDTMVDQIAQQSEYYSAMKDNAEAQAAINKWKASIRNGTLFDTSESGLPKGKAQMFIEDVISGFFRFTSTFGEAVSPMAGTLGVVAGAAVLGDKTPAHTKVGFGPAMGQ